MYARIKSRWENDINTEQLENTRRRDVPTVHAGARKLIMKAYPFVQPEAEGERTYFEPQESQENAVLTVFKVSEGKRSRVVKLLRSGHRQSNNND